MWCSDKPVTQEMLHEPIYEELKRVANHQEMTNYSAIAPLAGLDTDAEDRPLDRRRPTGGGLRRRSGGMPAPPDLEPVCPDDLAGSAEVAAKVAVPVAGYETCSYGRVSFRDYIAARAIHFVQPDVAWSGGLTEGLKIAHLAQAWNLPLAPHIHGSAVAVAAAVHLLGAVPNASMAEMVFPAHPLMADLVREPLLVDATGHLELSDRPGLGVELNPVVVAKYRVDR